MIEVFLTFFFTGLFAQNSKILHFGELFSLWCVLLHEVENPEL
jgi:hypothetical protein